MKSQIMSHYNTPHGCSYITQK